MRVVESSSRSRGAQPNLDRVVVTEHWAAVFDGTTPKSPDMEAATAATGRLVDVLVAEVRAAPPDLDPLDLVDALAAAASGLDLEHAPSAAGAVFSPASGRAVVIGDTWVSLDGEATFYGHEYEQLMTGVRRALTEAALADGTDPRELRRTDPGRRAVLELIAREAGLRNVDAAGRYFFAGIDGRPVPRRLLTEVVVPPGTRELCLASDGYPLLGSTLAESEMLLRQELADDPLRIGTHGGTKAVAPDAETFDDRSYLRLELRPEEP